MKLLPITLTVLLLLSSCDVEVTREYSNESDATSENVTSIDSMMINNLMRNKLEQDTGLEVVISYLEIPKNTTLPAHFHPGEEFAYVIEGSGELTLKDSGKQIIKAGEAAKVPLKNVHSFRTIEEGVKLVVFRVHEEGQPDRVLVDDH